MLVEVYAKWMDDESESEVVYIWKNLMNDQKKAPKRFFWRRRTN